MTAVMILTNVNNWCLRILLIKLKPKDYMILFYPILIPGKEKAEFFINHLDISLVFTQKLQNLVQNRS